MRLGWLGFTNGFTQTYGSSYVTFHATSFSTFMKIQFELRHDKQDKAGTVPVYILAYFDGLRLRCSTRERGEPHQ